MLVMMTSTTTDFKMLGTHGNYKPLDFINRISDN
jgi:hypothetical protein